MDDAFDQMVANGVPVGERITLRFGEPNLLYLQDKNSSVEKIRILGIAFERQIRSHEPVDVNVRLTHLLQVVTNDKKYHVNQEGKILRAGDEMLIPVVFKSVGARGEDMTVNLITKIRE
ncbi:hypothetical protein BH10CYA1_BH10CYA1_62240 [soil metagenome]